MYNVKWDNEINGILLTDDEGIVPPRPVFSENMILLKEHYIFKKNLLNSKELK